MKISKALR